MTSHGQALRHHPRSRIEPGQPHRRLAHRAPGLRRPACRPATTRARPARTSSSGSTTPRRAAGPTRPRGGRSWPTTRSPRSWAGSATGRARPPATGLSSTAAVGINSVERFLGDQAIQQGWPCADNAPVAAAPTGKRVLVVGAGPSGLSAAYHLTRLGHAVTIKDAGSQPGGMMRYGIPKYRLPRDILDAEIDRILAMGVTLELNTTVTDILAELASRRRPREAEGGFDAAFVAVGAQIGKRAYIPAGDSARIMDAVSLLHWVEDGDAAHARPPGRRLRRREHRHGRRAHRAQARRGRGRRGLPPHQGPDARPRHRGGGGAGRGRHDALALHGHRRRRPAR